MSGKTYDVGVMGCGWLGLPLAERLIRAGCRVKGTTTSPAKASVLRAAGIEPYVIELAPGIRGEDVVAFFDNDVLVLNIPPARRPDIEEYHAAQIRAVLTAVRASRCRFIVMASSTSVYPERGGEVDESCAAEPDKASGRALRAAENLLRHAGDVDCTILRLAGLIGPGRLPGNFLAGKVDVPGGDQPVNLIHRDDAVGLLVAICLRNVRNEIFNAVADGHPLRRDYYTAAAAALGLPPPRFAPAGGPPGKIVSNRKVRGVLGYEFQHPDPSRLIVAGPLC